MKRIFSCAVLSGLALSAVALPRADLDAVVISQTGKVKVSYVLREEPGIVTVDFQTNTASGAWVSIGVSNFTNVTGAVNRYVGQTGVRKEIFWKPAEAWPGHVVSNGFRAVVTAWPTNDPPDYAVFAIDGTKKCRFYTCAEAVPGGVGDAQYKTNSLVMRRVHADNRRFAMGAAWNERGNSASADCARHWVSFTNDWYMGIYELTQSQAQKMFGNRLAIAAHAEEANRDVLPCSQIHFADFIQYRISQANSATGGAASFSVPTEAQWEYTCRAGCPMALYNWRELGDDNANSNPSIASTNLNAIAWYSYNGGADSTSAVPHPVGLLQANAWGFYDMLGNEPEYCRDYYVDNPSALFDWSVEQVDPQGPTRAQTSDDGKYRVKRGGGIAVAASGNCACSRIYVHGSYNNEGVGIRLQCAAKFNLAEAE